MITSEFVVKDFSSILSDEVGTGTETEYSEWLGRFGTVDRRTVEVRSTHGERRVWRWVCNCTEVSSTAPDKFTWRMHFSDSLLGYSKDKLMKGRLTAAINHVTHSVTLLVIDVEPALLFGTLPWIRCKCGNAFEREFSCYHTHRDGKQAKLMRIAIDTKLFPFLSRPRP